MARINKSTASMSQHNYDGDGPSDWMRHGRAIYISIPGNNTVAVPIERMAVEDNGIITTANYGNLFSFDFSNTKAAGTWRWQP